MLAVLDGRISSRESQTKLLQIFHSENLDLKEQLSITRKQCIYIYIYILITFLLNNLVQEVNSKNESLEIENQRLNKILNDYSLLSSTVTSSSSETSSNKESKVSETDLFHYRQTLQVYYYFILYFYI